MSGIAAFVRDENGTTLTEYGILMASFAILSIASMISVTVAANALLASIFTGTTQMQNCPPGTALC
jgi:Flp pilus assembly pilin Flp